MLTRTFSRKPVTLDELKQMNHAAAFMKVILEKVIELEPERFQTFSQCLLDEQDFIRENISLMYMEADGTCHCLLVKEKGASDGILVESEGYEYARYAAYWNGGELNE